MASQVKFLLLSCTLLDVARDSCSAYVIASIFDGNADFTSSTE